MKTKKLTPRNAAPVKRENNATLAQGNAPLSQYCAPSQKLSDPKSMSFPFAGDDAE